MEVQQEVQISESRTGRELRKPVVWLLMLVLGFIMYTVAVMPIVIRHGGLFFYYGDYNVQQVPFYILAHRAIRNGQLFWNWNLDIGGDLFADLSFYLMGSPFFWLTMPFPEQVLPYMMPFIMALKYGVAAANGYLYVRRYTRHNLPAQMGGLLFAFSGFNACNIVFNHFTDAVAFFPLFVIAFEDLMAFEEDHNRGRFLLSGGRFIRFTVMVSICSIINYYFFFGQVIFMALIFAIRFVPGSNFRTVCRRLARGLGGGLLGVLLAGLFLMLAVSGVAGNSRLDNVLLGYDMVVYPSAQMYWDILKSFVMLPDIIGRGTLFYTATVKNASLAGYLPMFGLAGVLAYFKARKGISDWKKRAIIAAIIIAMIPVLNAMFSLFNSQYYARWFYMPILIMCMMTAQIVENDAGENIRFGTIIAILLFLLMIVIALLPARDENGTIVYLKMLQNSDMFWLDVLGTASFFAVLILVIFIPQHRRIRILASFAGVLVAGTFGTMITLINGSTLISEYGMQMWKKQMLDTRPDIDQTVFGRSETDSTSTNYEMCWGIPTIHCFLSTVPGPIFDFYEGACGISRSVESDSPLDRRGLRAVLSARYYFENTDINDTREFESGDGTPDYRRMTGINPQNGFTIFENENFIPMGFTFDYYTSESEWSANVPSAIDSELAKVLILPDEIADSYQGHMTRMSAVELGSDFMDSFDFRDQCERRAATSCTSFKTLKNGFTATTADFDEDEYVFFSVPNMKGFSCRVDGEPTDIVRADFGLIAIPVASGVHEIQVTYFPVGFAPGLCLTILGVILLIVYIVMYRIQSARAHASFITDGGPEPYESNDNEPEDTGETRKSTISNSGTADRG